jgi:hypothetical protein
VSGTLQVVESEYVLQLCLVVNNRSRTLILPLLEQVNEELFDVIGLLVAYNGGQILKELENLVLSKVLISFSEKFVVAVLDLEWVAHI